MFVAELEHAIGLACTSQQTMHIHPVTKEFIYALGSCVGMLKMSKFSPFFGICDANL